MRPLSDELLTTLWFFVAYFDIFTMATHIPRAQNNTANHLADHTTGADQKIANRVNFLPSSSTCLLKLHLPVAESGNKSKLDYICTYSSPSYHMNILITTCKQKYIVKIDKK